MPAAAIRHIFLAPLKNAPAKSVAHADALEGEGLEGDRYAEAVNRKGPQSEVTFIELEVIQAFTEATKLAMEPSGPRRNIVTEGIRLNDLVGRRFQAGEAVFEGMELCEPCGKFARNTHHAALRFFVHRGGLRARVVRSGVLRVGDEVRAVAE